MHYASRCAPVLSLRATAAAELEMVIDGIYKCHYCCHCGGRWLWDHFSVAMMMIFPFILLLQAMHGNACFFFNVAAKTKMFTEMNVTLRTLLVRPHGCFWFCFLFYGSTWLVSYMTSVSQTLQPSALALMKTEVVCTSCPCQSLKHTNAGGPSQRPFPYITA